MRSKKWNEYSSMKTHAMIILKLILQTHEAQDRNQWRTVVHTAVQTLYCFHRAFSLKCKPPEDGLRTETYVGEFGDTNKTII
jgi:hypothetical protein